jgi:tetratricopeptide (TPR) repeat protein
VNRQKLNYNQLDQEVRFCFLIVFILLSCITNVLADGFHSDDNFTASESKEILSRRTEGLAYLEKEKMVLLQAKNWDKLEPFLDMVLVYAGKTNNFESSTKLLDDISQSLPKNLNPSFKNLLILNKCWLGIHNMKYQSVFEYLEDLELSYLSDLQRSLVSFYKGQAHYGLNQYAEALEYFFEALPVFEKSKEIKYLMPLYNDFGLLYMTVGEYDKSITYYQKAVNLAEENGNKSSTPQYYSNLGVSYKELGAYQEALKNYQKGLEMSIESKDSLQIAQNRMNIGNIYMHLEQYQKAHEYYLSSIEICKKQQIQFGLFLNFINISENARKWKKYDLALSAIDSALIYSQGLNADYEKMRLLENKAELYYETGKFNQAFEELKSYQKLKDEIFKIETQLKIEELNLNHEEVMNEREIDLLRSELSFSKLKNSIFLILIIFGLLIFLGLIFFYNYNTRIKNILYRKNVENVRLHQIPLAKPEEDGHTKSTVTENTLEELYRKIHHIVVVKEGFKDSELNLSDLSSQLNSNVKYVSQAIQEQTNLNFRSYINSLRVQEAKKLMIRNDQLFSLSVSDIMIDCGFNNRNTFYGAFKSITGLSPLEFKKLAEKNSLENKNLKI